MTLVACSGGGGSGTGSTATPNTSLPLLQVEPANWDFGLVTNGNLSFLTPLEVTIKNKGTADLIVSGISLSDTENFYLNVDGGQRPCNAGDWTIPSEDSCTVEISFSPTMIDDDYTATLTIPSNDSNSPYRMSVIGTYQSISEINVTIHQVDACPNRTNANVYVSVTDQANFTVPGLVKSNFTLIEAGRDLGHPKETALIKDGMATISLALLMDYSGSILANPKNVEDMENGAIGFVDQLGDNDKAQIIKYAAEYEVMLPDYTSLKDDLIAAILSEPDLPLTGTLLYDTLVAAIDGLESSQSNRRAVILITDGVDIDGQTLSQLSERDISDVIEAANLRGIPIFTVGLGDGVRPDLLQQIAKDTGGIFFDAPTSNNLALVYQKLAKLVFTDQYILTYDSSLDDNLSGDLTVEVDYKDLKGFDIRTVLQCR
jgi:hypothetical protein